MIEAQGLFQQLLENFLNENELLKADPSQLADTLARVGAAREEYERQTAVAKAESFNILSDAIAEGVKKIRQAEAEGLLALGDALAKLDDSQPVIELMKMSSAQAVAKALSEGEATTIFGPSPIIDLLGLVNASSVVAKT